MQEPLIHWKALLTLGRQNKASDPKGNIFDEGDMPAIYNRMALLEREYTRDHLAVLGILPTDSVLDLCCGPGRIATLAAEKAAAVTALDGSERMLGYCRENATRFGVADKITPVCMNWHDVQPGENIQKHDVVIAARSLAMYDIEKLSALSNRLVAVIAFANTPNLPGTFNRIFAGTQEDGGEYPMSFDRRTGYNLLFNMVYDAGYEPNLVNLPDGFTDVYRTREEAYDALRKIRPFPDAYLPVFRQNVDRYLTETADGFVFRIETRAMILWWETQPDWKAR